MNKKELTLGLIRYRFTRNGVAMGMSMGEAAIMAETKLKNEGLLGFLGGMKVMGTPEGAIVSIMETYFATLIPLLSQDVDLAKKRLNAEETDRRSRALDARVFTAIEAHRGRLYPGTSNYPTELHSYVFYRMQVEMRAMHHLEPEEMGLDQEAVSHMVRAAGQFFKGQIGKFSKAA